MPFLPDLLLPHDKTLILALSKLRRDFKFGIGLEECPFAVDLHPREANFHGLQNQPDLRVAQ